MPHQSNKIGMAFARPSSISLHTRIILAVAACFMAATIVVTNTGSAATPGNGTITATSGPLTYTAGPFVVANESGQGGVISPLCQPNLPGGNNTCDQYTLTVNAATVRATKKLKIQIAWPNTAADFDLYVLQGTTEVGSSHLSANPETVILDIPLAPTVYTVRVIPTTPLGDSITGTISLVDNSPAPPQPSGLAPRYRAHTS